MVELPYLSVRLAAAARPARGASWAAQRLCGSLPSAARRCQRQGAAPERGGRGLIAGTGLDDAVVVERRGPQRRREGSVGRRRLGAPGNLREVPCCKRGTVEQGRQVVAGHPPHETHLG